MCSNASARSAEEEHLDCLFSSTSTWCSRGRSSVSFAGVADRERPYLGVYNVTWKRGVLSTARMRMVCEYEAADAETVRKVQRQAAAPFERVWVGDVIE